MNPSKKIALLYVDSDSLYRISPASTIFFSSLQNKTPRLSMFYGLLNIFWRKKLLCQDHFSFYYYTIIINIDDTLHLTTYKEPPQKNYKNKLELELERHKNCLIHSIKIWLKNRISFREVDSLIFHILW